MANNNTGIERKDSNNKSDHTKEQEILGIQVISSIVSKVETADPSTILSAIKEIIFFYRLLPEGWKKKASKLLDKLWNMGKVIISTDPEQPGNIYEVSFGDGKLDKLYNSVSKRDQAIMLQGKSMLDLINKGLHSDSDEIKKYVEERYRRRGLNIVDMMTTKDIEYLIEDIKESFNSEDYKKVFDYWALNYDSIASLVSPSELSNSKIVTSKIKEISKKTLKDYVLINLSGKMEDCAVLLTIISNLKEEKELNYFKMEHDISDSGFCKSLRIKLLFKNN
ncbi:MAG: hypothetical protein CVT90_00565 [Candidatus Altiarchaeales archaeon HGW-Altiarchaeales-3]|nr:MAG: hypothetical protein CVT90_00565 [Candidatus Altiarchaeales archaeon HGW-Altiarchaeales-3]